MAGDYYRFPPLMGDINYKFPTMAGDVACVPRWRGIKGVDNLLSKWFIETT